MTKMNKSMQLSMLITVFVPVLVAADLSTYRGFELGMSLDAAVKRSGMNISEVTTLHQRPTRIEELSWRPTRFYYSGDTDPVEQVVFSFCNGRLLRMVVTYDTDKTNGLTSEDIVEAVSRKYGTPTRPGITLVLPSQFYEDLVQVVARWEDTDNLFSLLELPYESSFQLVIVS